MQCIISAWKNLVEVNLSLHSKPLVPLLGDGELHPLALWQRDEWFASLRLICYNL